MEEVTGRIRRTWDGETADESWDNGWVVTLFKTHTKGGQGSLWAGKKNHMEAKNYILEIIDDSYLLESVFGYPVFSS